MRVSGTTAALAAGIDEPDLATSGVSIAPMPNLMHAVVGHQVQAMTLGQTIFVAPSGFDDVASGRSKELLAHELIHADQWESEGMVRFLARYLGDYVRLRAIGLDHAHAYRNIGYEFAAYEGAARIVDQS